MPSLLRTLIKPDWDDDPDKAQIAVAANLLQIGEFQVLQLAHFDWFATDMAPAELDRLFADYMIRHRVLPWMRHFARSVVERYERGEIDIDDPLWHRYDHVYERNVPHGVRRFIGACLVLIVFIAATLWVGQKGTGIASSMFPPYVETTDSQ